MYFEQYNIIPFIIMVQWPSYYCVNVFPSTIKLEIEARLRKLNRPAILPIIGLLNSQPKIFKMYELKTPWEEFKFWTKEKDLYRKEDFISTFNELGQLLLKYNEW